MNNARYILLLAVISTAACVKRPLPDNNIPPFETGKVTFEFENVAGDELLTLDRDWYTTENGDSIKFTTFNYYISNFVFVDDNGMEFKVPESYYLLKENRPESKKFTIDRIPTGNYIKLRLMIGVDSLRNVSGAQTGALDPSHGMFWDWNTGYIMGMIEGISPQSKMFNNLILFHLGGFAGTNNVTRLVTLELPVPLQITKSNNATVHIKADALEWFKTPHKISIEALTDNIISGGVPNIMADNYIDMFRIVHID